MDSWHLKPRCSVRIDAKPVLRIICVDFLSIATVKITLIKRELEDISGYPECSITFNGQLRNAIHSLYTSNSEFYERVRISRIRIIPTKTRPKFLIFLNKNNNLRKRTTATAGVIRPDSSHPCSYSGAYNSAPENPTS